MIDFLLLNIPIPDLIYTYSIEKQEEIYSYLLSLNDCQKKAYKIAFNHLGSSFSICNSNGFKEWKEKSLH
jgi:hypothetical protein